MEGYEGVAVVRGYRGGTAGVPPPNCGYCSANAERCERSVATTFYRLEGGSTPNGGILFRSAVNIDRR